MTEIGEGERFTRREFIKKAGEVFEKGGKVILVKEALKVIGWGAFLVGLWRAAEALRRSTEKTEEDFEVIGHYEGEVILPKEVSLRRLPIISEKAGEPPNKLNLDLKEDLKLKNPEVVKGTEWTTGILNGKEYSGDTWLKFEIVVEGKAMTVYTFEPFIRDNTSAKFIRKED